MGFSQTPETGVMGLPVGIGLAGAIGFEALGLHAMEPQGALIEGETPPQPLKTTINN